MPELQSVQLEGLVWPGLFAQGAEAKGLGWVETLSCKGRGALRSQCGGGGKVSRALVQQSALLLGLSPRLSLRCRWCTPSSWGCAGAAGAGQCPPALGARYWALLSAQHRWAAGSGAPPPG